MGVGVYCSLRLSCLFYMFALFSSTMVVFHGLLLLLVLCVGRAGVHGSSSALPLESVFSCVR